MPRPYSHSLQVALDSAPDDPLPGMVWTTITPYLDVKAGIRIGRGRADEFSRIQPSTFSCTLKNVDGRFTPENASSPYFPKIKTGKRLRYGVAVLGNGKQLYDDDPSFEGTAAFSWFADSTAPPTLSQSGAQKRTGLYSLSIAWGIGLGRAYRYIKGTIPGRMYTFSAYLYVPTGSPNISFGVQGGTTTVMSTKNAFTRVTRTFTATDFQTYMTITATGTGASQFAYLDDVQVEESAVATAFEITPGTFEWRFTGDVTEWPTKWGGGPAKYAETNLTAVDRLKRFGDLGEFDTFIAEDILDDSPIAYYPLNDPAGSITAGDASENQQPPAVIYSVGSGGTVGFGWDHTDGLFDYAVPDWYRDRTTGLQLIPSVLGTPVTGGYPQGKYLRGTLNAPISSNNGATVAAWTRFSGAGASAFGPIVFFTAADGSYLGVHRSAVSGLMCAIFVNMADGLGGVPQETTLSGWGPSDYVLQFAAVLSIPSAGNGLLTFYVNGTPNGTAGPFTMAHQPAWSQVTIGGRDKTVDGVARVNISHVAAYDYAVSGSAFVGQFYTAVQGRSGSAAGDTTTSRLRKLLQFRGLYGGVPFTGLTVLGSGAARIGQQEIAGDPNAAIELVENTEDGVFFIGGDGLGVWQLRNYRYNADPAVTITADQLDPEALAYRGDDFGIQNDVTASRPDGSSVRSVNAVSVNDVGRRKATLQALSVSDSDLAALAGRQTGAFGVQRNRLVGVKINLLSDPVQARACLTADIGSKIRITELPPQAPRTIENIYAEGWAEIISEEEWTMNFNTSPSAPWDAWQIGVPGKSEVGHTTIVRY